jgi:hypothetical protein
LGTFRPFGIRTAGITTRAASSTEARVRALQQRRFATFPMRRRRRLQAAAEAAGVGTAYTKTAIGDLTCLMAAKYNYVTNKI